MVLNHKMAKLKTPMERKDNDMNNPKLMKVWEQRKKLFAEANKLFAEGWKLDAKARGWKLFAEGNKLFAEGNTLWVNAVLKEYGDVQMGWEWNDKTKSCNCRLQYGKVEVYK